MWAVGNSDASTTSRTTLAEHWNGSSWSIVPTPNSSQPVNFLIGAAAVATNDVWAVGYAADSAQSSSVNHTLIEHWNGSSWRIVPSPNPTPNLGGGYPVSNELYSVAVVAADDVWAVGQSYNITAGQTLVEHWNGSTWSVVPAPHPGRYSDLRGVSAAGGAVWAVGNYDNNGLQSTLTERWNGSSWVRLTSPNVGPYTNNLLRVHVIGANDVWAVGYHLAVFGPSQQWQVSTLHWNGTAWNVVSAPSVNQRNNYLYDVSGTGPSDVWAVGFWDTGTQLRTLTEHWDGTGWTIVSSPNAHTYIDELFGVAAVAPNDVWAVGETFNGFLYNTLADHRSTACGGGTPSLSINDVRRTEGNGGATAFTFTVSLSAPTTRDVTVTLTTHDGSATAGSDYVAKTVTKTIPAGSTSVTSTVTVNGDTTVEPNEKFSYVLSNPFGATIADGTGVGTIVNDD